MAITQITISDTFSDRGNTIAAQNHSYTYSFPLNKTSELENASQNKIFLGVRVTHDCSLTNRYSNILDPKGSIKSFTNITFNSTYSTLRPSNIFVTNQLQELSFRVSYSVGGHGDGLITQKVYDYMWGQCTLDYYFADSENDININLITTQYCSFTYQIFSTEQWIITITPDTHYHLTSFNNSATTNKTQYFSTTQNTSCPIICERNVYTINFYENNTLLFSKNYNSGQEYEIEPLPNHSASIGYISIGWINKVSTDYAATFDSLNNIYLINKSHVRYPALYNPLRPQIYTTINQTANHEQILNWAIQDFPLIFQYHLSDDKLNHVDYGYYNQLFLKGSSLFAPQSRSGYSVEWTDENNILLSYASNGYYLTPSYNINNKVSYQIRYNDTVIKCYCIDGPTWTAIYTPNTYQVTISDGSGTSTTNSYIFDTDTIYLNAATIQNMRFWNWTFAYTDTPNTVQRTIYSANYDYINDIPANGTWTAHFIPESTIMYNDKQISQIFFFDDQGVKHTVSQVYGKLEENNFSLIYEAPTT